MENGYGLDVALDLTIPSRFLEKFDALAETPTLLVEIPIEHQPGEDQLTVHLERLQVSLKARAHTSAVLTPVVIDSTQVRATRLY